MKAEELISNLSPEAFAQLRRSLLQRVVLLVEANVKRRTPVRTGNLRRSITSRVEASGDRGTVGTNVKYARFVHNKRPFLEQGVDDSRAQIDRMLADMGQQFLDRASK